MVMVVDFLTFVNIEHIVNIPIKWKDVGLSHPIVIGVHIWVNKIKGFNNKLFRLIHDTSYHE